MERQPLTISLVILPLLDSPMDNGYILCSSRTFTTTFSAVVRPKPSRNAGVASTNGSTSPFNNHEGSVIFNRISGFVDPDDFTPGTITVTTSAAVSSTGTMTTPVPSLTSSKRDVGIGVGIGGFLGIALLITLWLLLRQKRHKEGFKREARSWEKKHSELIITQNGANEALQHQSLQQLHGWHPDELNSQMRLPHQLQGWTPHEIEGVPINEATSGSTTENTQSHGKACTAIVCIMSFIMSQSKLWSLVPCKGK
ncbi:hypothetical protein XPA_002454 [Xanthoria parietina]